MCRILLINFVENLLLEENQIGNKKTMFAYTNGA